MIDLPAFMDQVFTTTGKKMTYVGYGEGTTQLLYGLTQSEDSYFAEKLDKAVLLAPCVYATTLGLENYKGTFPVLRQ